MGRFPLAWQPSSVLEKMPEPADITVEATASWASLVVLVAGCLSRCVGLNCQSSHVPPLLFIIIIIIIIIIIGAFFLVRRLSSPLSSFSFFLSFFFFSIFFFLLQENAPSERPTGEMPPPPPPAATKEAPPAKARSTLAKLVSPFLRRKGKKKREAARVFGVPLDQLELHNGVPAVLQLMIDFLMRHGMHRATKKERKKQE